MRDAVSIQFAFDADTIDKYTHSLLPIFHRIKIFLQKYLA